MPLGEPQFVYIELIASAGGDDVSPSERAIRTI